MSKFILFSLLTVLGLLVHPIFSNKFKEHFRHILSNIDANNDGVLTVAEVNAFANSNGYLTKEECKMLFERGGEKMMMEELAMDLYKRLDTDQDGFLKTNEVPLEEREFFDNCDKYHVGYYHLGDILGCIRSSFEN